MPALPRGLTKPVTEHWDQIDETISRVLSDIGDPPDDYALEDDIREGMYGCGYWGCAYPVVTPSRRWTLKISADPTEGPLCKLVMDDPELREHPGIAYILGVWSLPVKVYGGKYTPWVILREDIEPLKTDDWMGWRKQKRQGEILHELQKLGRLVNGKIAAVNEAREQGKARLQLRRGEQLSALWYEWFGLVLEEQNIYQTHQIGSFMELFTDKFGSVLADIHAGNVGFRRHYLNDLGLPDHEPSDYWVIFDLGHSQVGSMTEIPRLPNPRRIPAIR